MKIIKIINKSKDGNRMEVIVERDDKRLVTKHLHKKEGNIWNYCSHYVYKPNGEVIPVVKEIFLEEEKND